MRWSDHAHLHRRRWQLTAVLPALDPEPNPCPTDINGDGVTNVLDLIELLLVFGTSCP